MIKLTTRQTDVLDCIRNHIQLTGFPPTRAEIARELGFRSANAAEDHLRALERKGVIEIASGSSRGIRLLVDDDESLPKGLPVVGRVAAGSPILAKQHIEEHIEINENVFHPTPSYLLRVRGDSMIEVGIFDGDLVAVKKTAMVENGQIAVARINDEVTVKRIQKKRGRIILYPENAAFQPMIVDANSGDFAIEGLVVGLIRQRL